MLRAALSLGESVTLSGTVSFSSITSSGVFFNSGTNDSPQSGSVTSGTNSMTGFFAGTKSDGTTVYSRFNGKDSAGFMTTNQGKDYITSQTTEIELSPPSTTTVYTFSITITLLADGNGDSYYQIDVGDGSEMQSVSFSASNSTSENIFDVVAFKCAGSGMTISDFFVTTTGTLVWNVPEPSIFGLFAGIAVLSVAGTRRRKVRK